MTGRYFSATMKGPISNQDCTDFFIHHDFEDDRPGKERIREWVRGLADAGIPVLFLNTAARRTNYNSEVWEAFWEGYDPDGPDDQAFLASVPPAERPGFRRMVHNMLRLHQQGIDFPDEVCRQCREAEILPWISIRMNDVHHHHNEGHPSHDAFWRAHPELRRQGIVGTFAKAFDYGHQAVRDHYLDLVVETLSRYDVDGVELDFMREPYLFSKGREEAGSRLLTAWVRLVSELCSQAGAQRGHPIGLAVRVPSAPDTSLAMGLDAVGWAREGLIDVLTVSPRWATMEFDIPMGDWRDQLQGTEAILAGGLDVRVEAYPGGVLTMASPEHAVGAAAQVLATGGDVVYLFNYFLESHPGWSRKQVEQTVSAMGALEALTLLPRRHAVTYRDTLAPYERYAPPLPASGPSASLSLPTATQPSAAATVVLDVLFRGGAGLGATLSAGINGCALELVRESCVGEDLLQVLYRVEPEALHDCARNEVRLEGTPQAAWQVEKLEVSIVPGADAEGSGGKAAGRSG